jgi:long-chain fatty acid transport protein
MRRTVILAAVLAAIVLGAPAPLLAGGATLFDVGTPDSGLAIAGRWAAADNACTALHNPAGMTRLEGRQILAGFQPLFGTVEFEPGAGTSTSGGDGGNAAVPAPIAALCYVRGFGEEDRLRFGLTTGGVAGGAFDFDEDWVGRYYLTELTFNVLGAGASLGYRVNDRVSIGASAGAALGILEQKARINNVLDSIPDGTLEVDDDTVAFAATVGVLIEASESTRFGVVWISEVDLDFEDALETDGVGPGLQAVLNATGLAGSELDLTLTVPQRAFFSWYHDLSDRLALMGNFGWENYEEFGFIDVSIKNTTTIDATADLQFDDTYHGAIGAKIALGERSAFTTGVAYDSAPVGGEDRSPALPLDEQIRIAFGYRRERPSGNEWAATLAVVDLGTADFDVGGGPGPSLRGRVRGEFDKNRVFAAGFSWNWR